MTLRQIDDADELRNYLRAAVQLEHATIPIYLTALYSMHPGANADAYRILRVVAVEEMLHLTLAANLLNAVGGDPDLTAPDFVPQFPAHLPDGETDFEVSIRPFSRATVESFLQIERPAKPAAAVRPALDDPDRSTGGVVRQRGAPAARRHLGLARLARKWSPRALLPVVHNDGVDLHFYSIGEFYAEVDRGLRHLHDALGDELFTGDRARQITPEYYYSGGGAVIPVLDLASALAACRLIGEQGEGHGGAIYDDEGEISHYYRVEQILLGAYYQPGDDPGKPTGPAFDVDWAAVYPLKVDAQLCDYPADSELHAAALRFVEFYQGFLADLTRAFTGAPEVLIPAVGGMFRLKELATQIIRNPIPGSAGLHGAPIYQARVTAEVATR